jgi:hypothetical protein
MKLAIKLCMLGWVCLSVMLAPCAAAARADDGDPLSGGDRFGLRGPQYVYGDNERVKIAVNVWGQVERPGSYLVPDDTDLVTLLSLAGGPTPMANLKTVKVARFSGPSPQTQSIDLQEMIDSPTGPPPGLLPGDTISVAKRSSTTWGSVLRTVYELALAAGTVALLVDRVN